MTKKAEKALGGTYHAGEEFEGAFGATTETTKCSQIIVHASCQKNLLKLEEKQYGYGDDFTFFKHKMINKVFRSIFRTSADIRITTSTIDMSEVGFVSYNLIICVAVLLCAAYGYSIVSPASPTNTFTRHDDSYASYYSRICC